MPSVMENGCTYMTCMMKKLRRAAALILTCAVCLAGCGSADSQESVEETSAEQQEELQEQYSSTSMVPVPSDMAYRYNTSAFVLNSVGDMTYTDSSYSYRDGIDVSSFNGDIDWNAVKNAGYTFVFIRIGYRGYESGAISADERFEEYYDGAVAAGLDVGVYFYSQALDEKEASEEASFVISRLAGRELQLPVVIDVEDPADVNVRTAAMQSDEYTTVVKKFMSDIEAEGYDTALYTNLYGETYMMNMYNLDGVKIWFSGFSETPNTEYTFDFWQYTNTGIVDGISGDVDLDIQMLPAGSDKASPMPE